MGKDKSFFRQAIDVRTGRPWIAVAVQPVSLKLIENHQNNIHLRWARRSQTHRFDRQERECHAGDSNPPPESVHFLTLSFFAFPHEQNEWQLIEILISLAPLARNFWKALRNVGRVAL